MSGNIPKLVVILVLGFVCILARAAAAQVQLPERGVLVLQNGNVLEGMIVIAGERFRLTMGKSDEVYIPMTSVRYRCRDLQDAYHRQLASIPAGDTNGHATLANWCIRYSLFEAAQQQIKTIHATSPEDARVTYLQERLTAAMKRKSEAAVETAVSTMLPIEQIEKQISHLPPRSVHDFAVSVQPILMNNCANGACHGGSKAGNFHLIRPGIGQALTRRFTQRNLHATLQLVDRKEPAKSALFNLTDESHAAVKSLFSDTSAVQLAVLRNWANAVSRDVVTQSPKTIDSESGGPLLQNNGGRSDVSAGDQVEEAPTVDVFDPSVFNRRFATED